jgi:hypothetical protein
VYRSGLADERSLCSYTIRAHHRFHRRFKKLQGHHRSAIAPRALKSLTRVRGHHRSAVAPQASKTLMNPAGLLSSSTDHSPNSKGSGFGRLDSTHSTLTSFFA